MVSKPRFWMIRAGFKSALAKDVGAKKAIAIGWPELGDLSAITTIEDAKALYVRHHSDEDVKRVQVLTAQIFRFVCDVHVDDYVITSVVPLKTFLVGRVSGNYRYDPSLFSPSYPNVRNVQWLGEIDRSVLSIRAQRALRSILTVFSVDSLADELVSRLGR